MRHEGRRSQGWLRFYPVVTTPVGGSLPSNLTAREREEDRVWGTGQGTGETEDAEVTNSSLFLLKSTISPMSLIYTFVSV